jgi:pilus assembly protein CpaC
MMKNWVIGLALLVSILGGMMPVEAQAKPGHGERLLVVIGKSEVLDIDTPFSEIIVGNPNIVDVVVMRPDSLYLLGKSLGTTNVQFLGPEGQILQIIDLVVGADIGEAKTALDAAFPDYPLQVHSVNGGIRLSGSLPDEEAIERAMEIAQKFLRSGGEGDSVINTLSMSDPPQVFLSVRIIEVARSVSQELSSSLSSLSVEATDASVDQWTLGPLDFTLEALAQNGLARLLATPTLTAQSGETASFLAGGEVPVPVPDGEGGNTIQFKEFGVRLTFTPKVIDGKSIRLQLEPEVSQVEAAVNQSVDTPSFTTRRANTTVTLNDGESFAIAGLLQNNQTRISARFPFLGELPVIGALFRDSTLRDSATDLLILVTPSLTQPTADASSINKPTDDRKAAYGWNFFAEGKHEVSTYKLRDALSGKEIEGPFGPILNSGSSGVMRGAGR